MIFISKNYSHYCNCWSESNKFNLYLCGVLFHFSLCFRLTSFFNLVLFSEWKKNRKKNRKKVNVSLKLCQRQSMKASKDQYPFSKKQQKHTLLEKCPYSEFFLSVFSRLRPEYEEILCIFPYSVSMRENMDQKNSEYRHFSRSDASPRKDNEQTGNRK